MKLLATAFVGVLALVQLAQAQEAPLPDPLVVVDDSFRLWSSGDLEGYFSYTGAALRRARQEDVLDADWGIVFATFADFIRNEQKNSPYALRLAEEGMAYMAPHITEAPEVAAILQVSRVYALADLGRYDEAVRSGRLAEPLIRSFIGVEIADGLMKDIHAWEQSQPTDYNNAPTDLARQALKDAQRAMDNGDYGAALSLAARAVLPQESGLDATEVTRINAAAAAKTGRALYWMNHKDEAFEVLRRAAETVAGPKWFNARTTDLTLDPGLEKQDLAELFFWLARAGQETDGLWIILPALDFATALDDGTIGTVPLLYARSAFYDLIDEPQKAEAALVAAVDSAKASGDAEAVLLSRYYLAVWRSVATGSDADLQTLIALTAEMAENGTSHSYYDPLHVQAETASLLRETRFSTEALGFARNALAGRIQFLSVSTDTQSGKDGQRSQSRQLVESLLYAAHSVDSDQPGADCSRTKVAGMGCVIFATK